MMNGKLNESVFLFEEKLHKGGKQEVDRNMENGNVLCKKWRSLKTQMEAIKD